MKLGPAVLWMALALSACAPARSETSPQRNSSRITQEEIVASLAVDAYDAIEKLRSNFLATRGSTSMRSADSALSAVFVDGMEYGPIASLRSIPASSIMEIRLFRSWEATTIYGTGYMSGVIAVTTRR